MPVRLITCGLVGSGVVNLELAVASAADAGIELQ